MGLASSRTTLDHHDHCLRQALRDGFPAASGGVLGPLACVLRRMGAESCGTGAGLVTVARQRVTQWRAVGTRQGADRPETIMRWGEGMRDLARLVISIPSHATASRTGVRSAPAVVPAVLA